MKPVEIFRYSTCDVKMAGDTDAASTPAQGSAEIEGSFHSKSKS